MRLWACCEGATVIKNPQLLLFPIVILGMIVSGIVGWRRHQKEVSQLQQFATKMGWSYTARDNRWTQISTRTPFGGQPMFNISKNVAIGMSSTVSSATDIVQGAYDQRPAAAFDYTVRKQQSGQNGSSETYRYAVCVITLPTLLPYLEIGHENVLDRVAQSMGGHDIQIESEGFNREFKVRSDDPKFASDVLSPQLAARLMSLPPEQWRIEGSNLISWRKGRLDVNALPAWLSMLSMVVSSIPTFVWHDHGVQGSQAPQPVAQVAPLPVAPIYAQQQQPTAMAYPLAAYAGTQYAPPPPAQPEYAQQPAQPEYAQQPAQPEYAQPPASAWPNQNILPGK